MLLLKYEKADFRIVKVFYLGETKKAFRTTQNNKMIKIGPDKKKWAAFAKILESIKRFRSSTFPAKRLNFSLVMVAKNNVNKGGGS